MDAVVCHDFGEASVEDVSKPTPRANEVLVEVSRVQLSLTECEIFRGVETSSYQVVRERLAADDGLLFGHEFSGTVVETGSEVSEFSVGDRVYPPGKIPCFECPHCKRGYTHFCPNREIIGRHRPGALAEYVAVPTHPLCRLPDGVSDAEGAALQPVASSSLAVHDGNISMGDVVVTLGTGVMGYSCAQFALLAGASHVVAVDIDEEKLNIAAERGMIPANPNTDDVSEQIDELTDGIGADVVFEAIGGEQSHVTDGGGPLAQAFNLIRPGGTIVQVGHVVGDVSVTPGKLRSKKVRWINPISGVVSHGPNSTSGEHTASAIASGRVSIEEYITHELNGLSSFEEALEITLDKPKYDARGPAQIVL